LLLAAGREGWKGFLMFHVKPNPHILLINPWITDFAAYNLWVRPLGLLYLASLLRVNGFRVTLIDCLDFPIRRREYRDGKFYKIKIEKPLPLKSVQRNYSQYGIPVEILLEKFSSLERPDLIAVTSGMTYWYPGVFKLIEISKKFFKDVPIVLGGIYATLCYEHAKEYSGADVVFKGGNEWDAIGLISELTDFQLRRAPHGMHGCPEPCEVQGELHEFPYPAFDLYSQLDYICIATSRGCPFHCTYCATPVLAKGFIRRDPFEVAEEIEYWTTRYPIHNIAFYDDALLVEPSKHFVPMMTEVIRRGIQCNFHTPNALHIRNMFEDVADILFQSGFRTIRLGFETSNEKMQIETGGKVDNREFQDAFRKLRGVGYSDKEIGVYIIAGLPGQRVGEVEESIAFVRETGARPILVEYSPIPHTPMFEKAKQMSSFDLDEPLFHNNSILPCRWEGFTLEDLKRLKDELRKG
jgi:radical SAM superfamily enzyme YgiQ (UPF0313 family)